MSGILDKAMNEIFGDDEFPDIGPNGMDYEMFEKFMDINSLNEALDSDVFPWEIISQTSHATSYQFSEDDGTDRMLRLHLMRFLPRELKFKSIDKAHEKAIKVMSIGSATGGSKRFGAVLKKPLSNPMRSFSTIAGAMKHYIETSYGKEMNGLIFKVSKKNGAKLKRVIPLIFKRKIKKFIPLDVSFSPDGKNHFFWFVRKGFDPVDVFKSPDFNSEDIFGKLGTLVGDGDDGTEGTPDTPPEFPAPITAQWIEDQFPADVKDNVAFDEYQDDKSPFDASFYYYDPVDIDEINPIFPDGMSLIITGLGESTHDGIEIKYDWDSQDGVIKSPPGDDGPYTYDFRPTVVEEINKYVSMVRKTINDMEDAEDDIPSPESFIDKVEEMLQTIDSIIFINRGDANRVYAEYEPVSGMDISVSVNKDDSSKFNVITEINGIVNTKNNINFDDVEILVNEYITAVLDIDNRDDIIDDKPTAKSFFDKLENILKIVEDKIEIERTMLSVLGTHNTNKDAYISVVATMKDSFRYNVMGDLNGSVDEKDVNFDRAEELTQKFVSLTMTSWDVVDEPDPDPDPITDTWKVGDVVDLYDVPEFYKSSSSYELAKKNRFVGTIKRLVPDEGKNLVILVVGERSTIRARYEALKSIHVGPIEPPIDDEPYFDVPAMVAEANRLNIDDEDDEIDILSGDSFLRISYDSDDGTIYKYLSIENLKSDTAKVAHNIDGDPINDLYNTTGECIIAIQRFFKMIDEMGVDIVDVDEDEISEYDIFKIMGNRYDISDIMGTIHVGVANKGYSSFPFKMEMSITHNKTNGMTEITYELWEINGESNGQEIIELDDRLRVFDQVRQLRDNFESRCDIINRAMKRGGNRSDNVDYVIDSTARHSTLTRSDNEVPALSAIKNMDTPYVEMIIADVTGEIHKRTEAKSMSEVTSMITEFIDYVNDIVRAEEDTADLTPLPRKDFLEEFMIQLRVTSLNPADWVVTRYEDREDVLLIKPNPKLGDKKDRKITAQRRDVKVNDIIINVWMRTTLVRSLTWGGYQALFDQMKQMRVEIDKDNTVMEPGTPGFDVKAGDTVLIKEDYSFHTSTEKALKKGKFRGVVIKVRDKSISLKVYGNRRTIGVDKIAIKEIIKSGVNIPDGPVSFQTFSGPKTKKNLEALEKTVNDLFGHTDFSIPGSVNMTNKIKIMNTMGKDQERILNSYPGMRDFFNESGPGRLANINIEGGKRISGASKAIGLHTSWGGFAFGAAEKAPHQIAIAPKELYLEEETEILTTGKWTVGVMEAPDGYEGYKSWSGNVDLLSSTFRHELGHGVQYRLPEQYDRTLSLAFREMSRERREELSRYAATDPHEYFAEAYAYMTSKYYNDSEHGDIIDSNYRQVILDALSGKIPFTEGK